MANSTIALNLRRFRKDRKFSQLAVAQKAGISPGTYRNIESGEAEPRVGTLQSIARVLEVRIQDLLVPVNELTAIRFRSNKRLRSRQQILVDVACWLADFNEVEGLVGDKVKNKLPSIHAGEGQSAERPVLAAAKVREVFGLGPNEPIRDICGLLEAHGVNVGPFPIASHDFFGLSIAPKDGGPAIIVNTWERIPVERWIFTAAHELGHLLLHLTDYDVNQTDENQEHEKQANAFAAAFLMPDAAFRKEWDETYGLPFINRVLKVKRLFRISYRSVLYRLVENGTVDKDIWVRFQSEFQRQYGKTLLREDEPEALAKDAFRASLPEYLAAREPERLSLFDFPGDRLSRLVRRAVEDEKITLSRAAEILRKSLLEMRELSASWVG